MRTFLSFTTTFIGTGIAIYVGFMVSLGVMLLSTNTVGLPPIQAFLFGLIPSLFIFLLRWGFYEVIDSPFDYRRWGVGTLLGSFGSGVFQYLLPRWFGLDTITRGLSDMVALALLSGWGLIAGIVFAGIQFPLVKSCLHQPITWFFSTASAWWVSYSLIWLGAFMAGD